MHTYENSVINATAGTRRTRRTSRAPVVAP